MCGADLALIGAYQRMCSCCVLGWQAGMVLLLLGNGSDSKFGLRSKVRCVWHMQIVISPLKCLYWDGKYSGNLIKVHYRHSSLYLPLSLPFLPLSLDRLFFATLRTKPRNSPTVTYFSTDDDETYEYAK